MTTSKTINLLEVASSAKETVTAAHSLDNTDFCPECGHRMERITVGPRTNPVEANACIAHRVCLPVKD